MASKENVLDEIIRIRFPKYKFLQLARMPSLLEPRPRCELNNDEEKLLSKVESYRSNLEQKSLEQCNAILKIARNKITKEKSKKEEERKELKKYIGKIQPKEKILARDADFEYWSKPAIWTLEEGVLLIEGTDPRTPYAMSEETWANIKKLLHQDDYLLAERALEAGKLNATNPPLKFIAWAKQIGLSVPDKLDELVTKMQVKSDSVDNNKQQSTIRDEKERRQQDREKQTAFPSGTKWEDMTWTFLSNELVMVGAKGAHKKYQYSELGFKDGRKGDRPDTRWAILSEFAKNNGEITWKAKIDNREKNRMTAAVRDIRKRLKVFFSIDDDPFHPYRKTKSYKTKFTIKDKRDINYTDDSKPGGFSEEEVKEYLNNSG